MLGIRVILARYADNTPIERFGNGSTNFLTIDYHRISHSSNATHLASQLPHFLSHLFVTFRRFGDEYSNLPQIIAPYRFPFKKLAERDCKSHVHAHISIPKRIEKLTLDTLRETFLDIGLKITR